MTRPARAQVNAQTCAVAYDTGETEELPVDDVIRDGIMSLGWQRARPTSGASSGRCFSGSGAFHGSLDRALIKTLFRGFSRSLGWQRVRPTSGASSGRCFSGSGAYCSPGSLLRMGLVRP